MKVFYLEDTNFGDQLVKPIFDKYNPDYVGKLVEGKIVSIGSILNQPDWIQEKDIIWGTGSILNKPYYPLDGMEFYAVRGPLTRELINGDCPEVYGDPALLMPEIYPLEQQKKYSVGLMPHFTDKIEKKDDPKCRFINIRGDWRDTINTMNECEMILTSSLHGVIVSEAYGIPVVWVKMNNEEYFKERGLFKFRDYFASTGRDVAYQTWDVGKVKPLDRGYIDLDPLRESLRRMVSKHL